MNDIDEKVRNFSKENKKRLNAKSYQRNKADLSKNYKDNREKILIKRSEYQAENKQKIKETKKAYYKRSIEKISKKNANYYQDHKDHLKAQKRKRKQDSEEAIRKIWIESGKKRCYERFVELQKEAREQNIKMKVHFELTRGREISILKRLGVTPKIEIQFQKIFKDIEELYCNFDYQIDEAIIEIDIASLDLDYHELGKLKEKKFYRFRDPMKSYSAETSSPGSIYFEYREIQKKADLLLKSISDDFNHSMSFDTDCCGRFTRHRKGEEFPGSCFMCKKTYEKIVGKKKMVCSFERKENQTEQEELNDYLKFKRFNFFSL